MLFNVEKILKLIWLFVIICTTSLITFYKLTGIEFDSTFYILLFTFLFSYLPFTIQYKKFHVKQQQELLVINGCIATLIVAMVLPLPSHAFLYFIPVLSILIQNNKIFYIINSVVLISYMTSDFNSYIEMFSQTAVFICFIILVRYVGGLIFSSMRRNFYFRKMINALVFAIETKDVYTRGHSLRVAEYTYILGKHYNAFGGKLDLDTLKIGAMLHDIGKVHIPDHIITKEGPLSLEEYSEIKIHPEYGAEIARDFDYPSEIIGDILYHHERYDGKGYPYGLTGNEIPITARIIAIADTFDAITSNRSYRTAFSIDKANSIIAENFGTQFDPSLKEVYMSAFPELSKKKVKFESSNYLEERRAI
ncbi:MAG: hypothetical protein K0S51_2125 [Bacillales bacterium]|jgi:putative nucleotidyltransferase with HDIG domain|nr:hypothetical protein [Bacillales bacterium]